MKPSIAPLLLTSLLGALPFCPAAPPDFGPRVLLLDPSMPNIQERIDAVFTEQERSQFGSGRYALLFKPGAYRLDVRVGYYTQVAGLGRSPDDVVITGAVRSPADWMPGHNATLNFWRSVENLAILPTRSRKTNVWAVSQGTTLRRLHIHGHLALSEAGWSSGGFLADCLIDGRVDSGTQQQWLSRNAAWGRWTGRGWNMVFVGVQPPPAGQWPDPPYTVVPKTPVSREKPWLCLEADGSYAVFVPDSSPADTTGITWAKAPTPGKILALSAFHIARPEADTAASLNAALAAGRHLLFTPGIYHLESALAVTHPGTVVLGLGYPTLVPDQGTPALTVADVDGVILSGLLLEAGPIESPVLLQVGGPEGSTAPVAEPTYLHDLFCRVGGAAVGAARTQVIINRSRVVGDNLWLWRADHGRGAAWGVNRNAHGLIVNGDEVTLYGLFVEHTQEYQTLWNGNGGRVYLYQSELPYDPPDQAAWRSGAGYGFAAYRVADTVTTHEAWGLGIYAVFKHTPVILDNAVESPVAPGIRFHHLVTYRLNRQPGSGIRHVLNGLGDQVITRKSARVAEWPPPADR